MSDRDSQPPAAEENLVDWQPPDRPARRVLTGRHARLEPLSSVAHANALHARHVTDADPAGWRFLGYGPFASLVAYRDWVQQMTHGDDPLMYAIVDHRRDDKPRGVAGFLRIGPEHGTIEVGHIHFTHALRRTPAATEAIALLLGTAFDLGYRRVEWKCHHLNRASRMAAARYGFSFEGVFRQHQVVKGRNRDTAWFSMLDHEWPERRAALEAWLSPDNFDADGRQRERLSKLMPQPETGFVGDQP